MEGRLRDYSVAPGMPMAARKEQLGFTE